MSKLNIEFMDDNMNFCSKVENDLEEEIGKLLEQYEESDMPWESLERDLFEQLFVDRGFLLAWYPFIAGAEILEIGAGVGALTGILCKKASRVIAVEKKQKRAELLRKRYRKFSNLEVVQENYAELPYQQKFDYIVVHDIFGYIKKYVHTDKPYETFFHKLTDMLKEDGIILLAVENRLGIKYFSGAIENYSNKFFVGLDNFDGYDVIYTPTRGELENILIKSGISHYKFYYPFPDDIFSTEIYTDHSLQYLLYGGKSEETGWDRFELFNEREMYETLQREGMVQNFVNSFLLEIGNPNRFSKINYCKLITSKENGEFKYIAIADDTYFDSNCVKHTLKNGSESLHKRLSDLIFQARSAGTAAGQYCQKIYDCFKQVKELLEAAGSSETDIYTENFVAEFGDARINNSGRCIDFFEVTTKNIFCKDNQFQIFLEKNVCKVPVNYMVWQIVYDWYVNNVWERKSRMKLVSLKKIYDICGLNSEDIQIFKKWQDHYKDRQSISKVQKKYVDWYKQDFIYPVDVLVTGDMIRRDFSTGNDLNNQLLMEKEVLDEIR